jgi:serine phosphatase RsbU (regulator of sigma subunit)
VDVRQGLVDLRQAWRTGHLFVLIPIALIVLISAIDLTISPNIHLGPLLVVAPAITASFAGSRLTALIGLLAVAAQVVIGAFHGGLWTTNHQAQIAGLAIVSAMIVFYCRVREKHASQLTQVRSVSEAVQRVLLRPLPERLGPLRVAALYLAAEDEAHVGGDLFAAARAGGSTRLVIGDVRGKGLEAVGDAAALLGAFRELAYHPGDLPALTGGLEASFARHLAELLEAGEYVAERFVTALLVDLPDAEPVVRLVDCGHPPPLLLRGGEVRTLDVVHLSPPLGMGAILGDGYDVASFAFEPGDLLVFYTDGITEARSHDHVFFPLADRIAVHAGAAPEVMLRRLHVDLLNHVGGRLGDDAALVVIERVG